MSATDLRDRNGIRFDQYAKHLPERVSDWSPAHRIRLGGLARWKFFAAIHAEADFCIACGRRRGEGTIVLEAHHLSRSDERTCVAVLCREYSSGPSCHPSVAGNTAKLLWSMARWCQDDLDWCRIAVLMNRKLDRPIAPPGVLDFWLPGFVTPRRERIRT
jgi:hypothetical protein